MKIDLLELNDHTGLPRDRMGVAKSFFELPFHLDDQKVSFILFYVGQLQWMSFFKGVKNNPIQYKI